MKRKIVGIQFRKNARPQKHTEYAMNAYLVDSKGEKHKVTIKSNLKREIAKEVELHKQAIESGKLHITGNDEDTQLIFN